MTPERPYAEESIWRPIAKDPSVLGYPRALTLNHIQLGNQSGYIDLVLFPEAGKRIVLVEAKRADDTRSSADVLGQILKYYANVLALGSDGIDMMRDKAKQWGRGNRPSRQLSLKLLCDARSQDEAVEKACRGRPLMPEDIGLVIALDRKAPKLEPRLLKSADALERHHGLSVGVCVVTHDSVTWLRQSSGNRSLSKNSG